MHCASDRSDGMRLHSSGVLGLQVKGGGIGIKGWVVVMDGAWSAALFRPLRRCVEMEGGFGERVSTK